MKWTSRQPNQCLQLASREWHCLEFGDQLITPSSIPLTLSQSLFISISVERNSAYRSEMKVDASSVSFGFTSLAVWMYLRMKCVFRIFCLNHPIMLWPLFFISSTLIILSLFPYPTLLPPPSIRGSSRKCPSSSRPCRPSPRQMLSELPLLPRLSELYQRVRPAADNGGVLAHSLPPFGLFPHCAKFRTT